MSRVDLQRVGRRLTYLGRRQEVRHRLTNSLMAEIEGEALLEGVMSANAALVLTYWEIGRAILERQETQGWGARVIDRLSHDLKAAFPDMSGFSPRNLQYMRKFAEAWPDRGNVQRTVAQLPWRSNLTPIDAAEWEFRLTQALPEDLKTSLPSEEEIDAELEALGEGTEGVEHDRGR